MGRILITGMGCLSAIGNNVSENHLSLSQGNCGIRAERRFASRYSGLLPFGEIEAGTDELKDRLRISDAGVTRTTLLALHAFREAVSDAGLTLPQITSSDTALVGATTVGGICLTDELYRDANSKISGSPFFSSYDCASVALYLQEHYQLNGIVNTINTACSSSANAVMYGARLIKTGL